MYLELKVEKREWKVRFPQKRSISLVNWRFNKTNEIIKISISWELNLRDQWLFLDGTDAFLVGPRGDRSKAFPDMMAPVPPITLPLSTIVWMTGFQGRNADHNNWQVNMLRKCCSWPIIKEMQVKATTRYHYIPMGIPEYLQHQMLVRM